MINKILLWLQDCIKPWTKPATLTLASGLLSDLTRSCMDLMAENAMMRQQLTACFAPETSYCHAAKRGCMAGTREFIQVNVEGTLVSGESASISVANSIHWHTSKKVRELAEAMIDEMSNGAFARQWPQISLTLPVEYPAVSGRPGRRSRGSG